VSGKSPSALGVGVSDGCRWEEVSGVTHRECVALADNFTVRSRAEGICGAEEEAVIWGVAMD